MKLKTNGPSKPVELPKQLRTHELPGAVTTNAPSAPVINQDKSRFTGTVKVEVNKPQAVPLPVRQSKTSGDWLGAVVEQKPHTSVKGELTAAALFEALAPGGQVTLSPQAEQKMAYARSKTLESLEKTGQRVYGWNQALGPLKDVEIDPKSSAEFQRRILMTGAAGLGEPFSDDVARLTLLIRANAMARGHMGVRPELAKRLLDMFNAGLVPVMPSTGSLGTGDLQPMSALGLALIGDPDAELKLDGKVGPARELLQKAGLDPDFKLEQGEALALISGSSVLTAQLAVALKKAKELSELSTVSMALFSEATRAEPGNYDPRTHAERHFGGQIDAARDIAKLLDGTQWTSPEARQKMGETHDRIQDSVAVRATPHIHGTVRSAVNDAMQVLENELKSSTSNPLVFEKTDGSGDWEFVMGGNWEGGELGFRADSLNAAITNLAVLSTELSGRLNNPQWSYGLPQSLTGGDPGINGGMVVLQSQQVALVPQMQTAAMPAGILSRPMKSGQEDHNSMAMTSVQNLTENLDRLETVLAIQLLMCAQGIDLAKRKLGDTPMGAGTSKLHALIREHVPMLIDDRPMAKDVATMRKLIETGALLDVARKALAE